MSHISYTYKHITQDFLVFNVLYAFGKPVFASTRMKELFQSNEANRFGVIEKNPYIGMGYIGIATPDNIDQERLDSHEIIHLAGTYHVAEFVGSYDDFLPSLKQVKRENPFGVGWHTIYINNPEEREHDMISWVLFRNDIRA